MNKKKVKSAKEFDDLFEKDLDSALDQMNKSVKKVQKVNIDFPVEFLSDIDEVASKLGVSRQSLLKVWINDRLIQERINQKKAN